MGKTWSWLRVGFQREEIAKAKACGQEIIKLTQGTARILGKGIMENRKRITKVSHTFSNKHTHRNSTNVFICDF